MNTVGWAFFLTEANSVIWELAHSKEIFLGAEVIIINLVLFKLACAVGMSAILGAAVLDGGFRNGPDVGGLLSAGT